MDLSFRVLFHRFQIIFDRIRLTFSVAIGHFTVVLNYLTMNASEAGGDLALIQTSLLFSCKYKLVSIRTT